MKTTPGIIDTHCHLNLEAFDPDRDKVLQYSRQSGVIAQIIPATEASGWEQLLELCSEHHDLYPALGLHPVFLQQHTPANIEKLAITAKTAHPVAIGEIGLDFAIKSLDRDTQQQLFEAQLIIAKNAGLPVIIHARKSHDVVIRLLRKHRISSGTIHAFSGSLQQGMHYYELGFKLGFGGMLTFERSRKLRQLAHDLPAEALVLETDAPDMTVAAHRGERNSPQYLPHVLAALAGARDESLEEVARYTTNNARSLFHL